MRHSGPRRGSSSCERSRRLAGRRGFGQGNDLSEISRRLDPVRRRASQFKSGRPSARVSPVFQLRRRSAQEPTKFPGETFSVVRVIAVEAGRDRRREGDAPGTRGREKPGADGAYRKTNEMQPKSRRDHSLQFSAPVQNLAVFASARRRGVRRPRSTPSMIRAAKKRGAVTSAPGGSCDRVTDRKSGFRKFGRRRPRAVAPEDVRAGGFTNSRYASRRGSTGGDRGGSRFTALHWRRPGTAPLSCLFSTRRHRILGPVALPSGPIKRLCFGFYLRRR